MKTSENKNNQVLTLIGLSLLALAGDESNGLYQEVITRLAPQRQSEETAPVQNTSEYLVGVRGVADYLHSSPPTIQKMINEGRLDEAMSKVGRKYLFARRKIDEIFAVKTAK